MLKQSNTQLVIIDVQGKLADLMYQHEELFERLTLLIQGAKLMSLPIVWAEQLPDKLGATTPQIANLLAPLEPFSKSTFSAFKEPSIQQAIEQSQCKQVLLVGIEAHICVYQTAMDLLAHGYDVHLVTDAISSRTFENKSLAIEKLTHEGAKLTSTEMALFELQQVAEGEQFRSLIKLVK
jgi:nicotinamidase-related amidase